MNALIFLAAAAGSPALEPVIVTATRTEVPAADTLASVDIITGSNLQMRPAADLGDALRFVPGVEVARLGGPGQQTSLFLRGTESNHVLVLIDGLRMNPGTIGTAAIQNVAPEFVERVEVVKGPRSTLYGSDAIGGVINIITRRGADAGRQRAGGLRRLRHDDSASFSAGIGDERAEASIAASWLDSAGFPTRIGDDTDRGYENTSFNAYARAGAGPVELSLSAWYAPALRSTRISSSRPSTRTSRTRRSRSPRISRRPRPGRRSSPLAHAIDDLEQNQSADFLDTKRNTVDWQNDFALSRSAAHCHGRRALAGRGSRRRVLRRALCGRHDDEPVLRPGPGELRPAPPAARRGLHRPRNLRWPRDVERGVRLRLRRRARSSRSRRARRFARRTPRTCTASAATRTSSRRSRRASKLSWRQAIGERQSFSLTAFRNDIDELIEFVVIDPDTFEGENRNVAKARIEGVEAAWHYDGERWSARAAATLQDPRDRTTDARLLRRARENYTAAIARRFGDGHEVAFDLLYAGERRDFGFPSPIVLPAYWLANLSAKVALSERFTLVARVENLFDEDYELASGYNTMGQSFFGALRYEFR